MKIIRYLLNNSTVAQIGCVENEKVYSLVRDPLGEMQPGRCVAMLNEVKLLAPCEPKKIIAMAINFSGIDGFSNEMSEPLVFIMPGTCVCAPEETVINPFPELPWWGEAELAVVIKKQTRNVPIEQVGEYILGFTIGNDTTVENVEGRDHHLARSKCPDNFCPIGPWIDTEFDATDCIIEAIQNGEVIRRGRSSEQIWQWPEILSWLSTWMTLEPWDVVLTGNPPDTVGMRYLGNDDTYTAKITGLGELTNRFIKHPKGNM